MTTKQTTGSADRESETVQLFERVLSLAEHAAASHRFASDAGADAGSTVLAELLEDDSADRSDQAIAKRIANALARDRRAAQSALALVTATAERSDRSPALAWEPLTMTAQRAAAASLTAGDVETMTDEKVSAVLASHSGVSGIRSRRVGAAVLRSAHRSLVGLAAMTDALRDALRPSTVSDDDETIPRRTQGARWSTVSTAGGEYRETGTDDETGATTYGLDAGSVAGIRHRDSDAGNGAHTLRLVHSAETALLRDAGASSLRAALSSPFSPEHAGRGRPSSAQSHAWETVARYAAISGVSVAALVGAHALDPTYTRNGRRVSGARVRWSALASTVGLPTDETTTRALARAVTAWASDSERRAWDAQRPTATSDGTRNAMPDYSTPERILYASTDSDSETVAAFTAWDAARRLFVSVASPTYATRRGVTVDGLRQYRDRVVSFARGTASDRQRALALLAHAVSDETVSLLALVDRRVSVSSLSPSPTCRVGNARGMTDPRYAPDISGMTATGHATVDPTYHYAPDDDSAALRIAAKGWGAE